MKRYQIKGRGIWDRQRSMHFFEGSRFWKEYQAWQAKGNEPDLEESEEERQARLEQALRLRRDQLLSQCDWTQSLDAPLSDAQKQAWRFYRQALREMPQETVDLAHPLWPQAPQ